MGAGGLGCEVLHLLALNHSVQTIAVVDDDTISISNLNRQMFYTEAEVGMSKAKVAAQKLRTMRPDLNIIGHECRMESMLDISAFNIIYCCLDTIEGRRWINEKLYAIGWNGVLIEGGTEGWQGHVRWIRPNKPGCLECSMLLHTATNRIPLCTLHTKPTSFEHCVQWAMEQDCDLMAIHRIASQRALEFGIQADDWEFTKSVIKGIIPAIATTNAIIAGIMCNQQPHHVNYAFWNGQQGAYLWTSSLEPDPSCPICANK